MKKIVFIALLFVGSLLFLKLYNESFLVEKEESKSDSCDYFNGKVLQVSEEYIYVEPTEEWEWRKVSRVKISLKGFKEFDSSIWKIGNMIRVAYNSSSMEWEEDEVSISIVFQIFMMSELD